MSPASICIVITSDGERYRVVDITGAPNGSFIRELVFSKLSIPNDRRPHFSIYQTEIGRYALGGPLTNAVLFDLCRQYGDHAGSLKFFISTFPDRPSAQLAGYPTSPILTYARQGY